jgi:chromosome segregation ATPase
VLYALLRPSHDITSRRAARCSPFDAVDMDNQIVPRTQSPEVAEEEGREAARRETVLSQISQLVRQHAQLAHVQVQAVHAAKGYIDERVMGVEQEARSYAEALGQALSQVQVDQHVLKEHLSVYLQAIAETARQQIDGVYQDLQTRHAVSLQSHDRRVDELGREVHATRDAVMLNEQAIQRIDANQSRIDHAEQGLKEAQKNIESQAATLIKFARRIETLEEQIANSNRLETRIFERVDKMLATSQLATTASITKLSGRMDRYDDRSARTASRLDLLVEDAKKQLKATIETESKELEKRMLSTESRMQSAATVSRARFDETFASIQATMAAQASEILTIETNVAQLAASRSRDTLAVKVSEHSEQITAINRQLSDKEREILLLDESIAEKNQEIRAVKFAQEQQHTTVQQLFRLSQAMQPPTVPGGIASCEQHRLVDAKVSHLSELVMQQQASQHAMQTKIEHLVRVTESPSARLSVERRTREDDQAEFTKLWERIADQGDSQREMQAKIDKLDGSIEDRVDAWFTHATAVQGESSADSLLAMSELCEWR